MESVESIDPSNAPRESRPHIPNEEPSEAREWRSPGVSLRKRILTGLGVALATAIFFLITFKEGAPAIVSTIIGVVFIGCFIWYLRIVAPTPFTIRLDDTGVTRTDEGNEPAIIPWSGIAKVKEEVYKNGTSVSLMLYKRVGERGLHRAWVVYRDDIPRFDDLVSALQGVLPSDTPWIREHVHE